MTARRGWQEAPASFSNYIMETIENEDENDMLHRIICGSNLEVLPRFFHNSHDLVVTSPPYANQRKKNYNSISEEDYPEWTVEWVEAVSRVLTPTASVFIVIRSHIKNGFVSPYVLDTRLALFDAGWREPQEIVWWKPDALPVGRKDRCRQAHEQVLWFSKRPDKVYCKPKANGTMSNRIAELKAAPDGNGKGFSSTRTTIGGRKFLSAYAETKDRQRPRSKAFRSNVLEEVPALKVQTTGIARCTDVVRAAVGGCNRAKYNDHPAQHPTDLYRWLIRLACPPGGRVLDPFAGSGTTMEAAYLEGRGSTSIELEEKYAEIIRRRKNDLLYPAMALTS